MRHTDATAAIGAEQALLGSLMLESKAYARVADVLERSYFVRPDHGVIWDAIGRLMERGAATDPATVIDELDRTHRLEDAGGAAYVSSIARETPTAANVESYAAAVRDRARLAQLATLGRNLAREAEEGVPAAELITSMIDRLVRLQMGSGARGAVHAREALQELIGELSKENQAANRIMTGFEDFDRLTGGLRGGQLVVVAGRPGTGKTTWAVNAAGYVARTTTTLIFEAEMTRQELVEQAVAKLGDVSRGRLIRPEQLTDADWQGIGAADRAIAGLKLWIDDSPTPKLSHLRAEAYATKAKHGLGLIVVDYAQLVKGEARNIRENVGEVIYGLKALGKELNVPVIALAQLNRGVESRDDKRPRIPDLKESGDIEQAADVIILLYREWNNNRSFAMRNVVEAEIPKFRRGEIGHCLWDFDGEHSRMCTLDDDAAAQYRHLLGQGTRQADADI